MCGQENEEQGMKIRQLALHAERYQDELASLQSSNQVLFLLPVSMHLVDIQGVNSYRASYSLQENGW